jgi:hypothetical protein
LRLFFLAALSLAAAGCALGDDGVVPRMHDGAAQDEDAGPRDAGGGECIEGALVPCTTSCGSAGEALCTAGRAGACAAPDETCDGTDEDCDGAIDESIAARTCTAACGGGQSRCEGGSFTPCEGGTPSVETCDGTDEDCDGAIDDGVSRACTAACGAGRETCANGVYGACVGPAPQAEVCDNVDQDCDGAIDDGVSRDCSTACGVGRETCAAGVFGGCTAPAPQTESCNLGDDDCDGSTDEGFQAYVFDPVPMGELTAQQPACDGANGRLDLCMTAAKRWCHAHAWGCFAGGGAGHLQATASGARIVCFGNRGDEHDVSFAEVSVGASTAIDDTNVHTRLAQSAVNRYCQRRGFAAGVGPTEWGSGAMRVTCLPADVADTVSIGTSELQAIGCDPISNPNPLGCSSASDGACRARGFVSGYGPVEWNTTDSAIVCFRAG